MKNTVIAKPIMRSKLRLALGKTYHTLYNEPRKQDRQNGQNKLECSYG